MRGHVGKRGKSWYAVVDVPPTGGKRKQRWKSGFATRNDAEAYLAALLADIKRGEYAEPGRLTLADFLHRWLDDYVTLAVEESTQKKYRSVVRCCIEPEIGGVKLDKLTPLIIQNLYRDLSIGKRRAGGGSLAPTTVGAVHRVLKLALNRAVEWNILPRNPAAHAKPPKVPRREMVVLTPEQAAVFLERTKGDRLHAAYHLLLNTALRRGELLGLRWADVDLEGGYITVAQAQRESGKFAAPKTDAGRRKIALSPEVVASLRRHQAGQAMEKLRAGSKYTDSGLVFRNAFGAKLTPGRFLEALKAAERAAGLPPLNVRAMRHTSATLAIAAGTNVKVLQERLGHAHIGTTLQIYSHVPPGLQEQAALAIENVLHTAHEKRRRRSS